MPLPQTFELYLQREGSPPSFRPILCAQGDLVAKMREMLTAEDLDSVEARFGDELVWKIVKD